MQFNPHVAIIRRMGAYHRARRIALRRLVRQTDVDPMDVSIADALRVLLIDDLATGD